MTALNRMYAEEAQAKDESKQTESCEFEKIFNHILNRGKASLPTIINGFRSSYQIRQSSLIFTSN